MSEWISVKFCERYSVNECGQIKNNETGKLLKPFQLKSGYLAAMLYDNESGRKKTFRVHRLVAEAFIDNPDDLPMVNHKDEDKTNNFAENLEWCTNEYNVNYGSARKRQARKLRGVPHTEEHKRKISESLKRHYGERKDNG
jgi:hypothetical protein